MMRPDSLFVLKTRVSEMERRVKDAIREKERLVEQIE